MENFEVRTDVSVEDLNEAEKEALKELARRVLEEGENLQEALGISEEYIQTMEFYAHYLYNHGKWDEAGVLVEGVLALDEERYYPYLLVGDVAMQEERWEEAVKCLGAAIAFGPEDPMLEGKIGEALLRVGRVEDALFHLQKALALGDEEDKYAKRSKVLIQMLSQEVEEAVEGSSDSEG